MLSTEFLPSILESIFINGLKEELRKEVRVMKSNGLKEIMGMAQLIEDKNSKDSARTSQGGKNGTVDRSVR